MTSEDGDRSDRLRASFARRVAARGGAVPRVAEALAAVPRESFAGPRRRTVDGMGMTRR